MQLSKPPNLHTSIKTTSATKQKEKPENMFRTFAIKTVFDMTKICAIKKA